jgi:hypothetical protein
MKREYDFRGGKRGAVVAAPRGKTRITIRLDDEVLECSATRWNAPAGATIKRSSTNVGAGTWKARMSLSRKRFAALSEKSCAERRSRTGR